MNDSMGFTLSAIAEAKQRLRITALWPMLGLSGRPAKRCHSPFREDKDASFSVFTAKDGVERFKDFATGESGDAIEFLARARGITNREALPEFLWRANSEQINSTDPILYRCTERTAAGTDREGDKPRIHPANFRIGTTAELQALSRLRGISVEGLQVASERGVLRFGQCQGFPTWTVLDCTYRLAQSRRLDGELFVGGGKSQSWKGSQQAWPLNVHSLGGLSKAALVEGGPDMLAAFDYAFAEGKENTVAVIGMLGASCSIPDDALPLFKGKQVRIFPHVDEAGRKAGERWNEQLESAGAVLSWFDFDGLTQDSGEPVKDFNDLCRISYDDFERDRELWGLLP
jgi:hypothetical protein